MPYPGFHFPVRQRGAILIVSLLLLLVMTVLALTASQTTRFQERMAGNARDLDLSFQAGEAALRASEKVVEGDLQPRGAQAIACGSLDTCDALDRLSAPLDYRNQSTEWWDESSKEFDKTLKAVNKEPQFINEEWTRVKDTLTKGGPTAESGTIYYINTARAEGATDTAVTVLETVYAVRY